MVDTVALNEQIKRESQFVNKLLGEVGKVVVGQRHMLERILMGFLTEGHVLLEGVPGLAKTLTIRSMSDAIVVDVAPGGPADRGGIEPYDIVTEYNGKEVPDARMLIASVGDTPVGQTAKLKILRDGKPYTLNIKIVERPDEVAMGGGDPEGERRPPGSVEAPFNLGVILADLNPALAERLQLPEGQKRGVVVVGVKQGSIAAEAGLHPGDVILDINKRTARTAFQAAKSFKQGVNSLRVLRESGTALIFMEAK